MSAETLSKKIGENLPYLRRYARALTGSQQRGDAYAAAALEAILEHPAVFDSELGAKAALFKVFHSIWVSARSGPTDGSNELERMAQKHLAALTADTREALLLHTIEEFDFDQIAAIMETDPEEAESLVDIAYKEMSKSMSGRILIIEDEPIISVDLEDIVSTMGHRVTGIARTAERAVELASKERPDLILSDIQLADNSSGLDAVNRILANHPQTPVIVVTSFPERLLTGETDEPTFLITKPYEEAQIRSSVSQAMFFASIQTLRA
jgi:DNA-directed RNA polymerase specialized sigma24 family protein